MLDLVVIFVLIWAHFIGDFILQSDYHAANKSKSNLVLFQHVLLYSLPFTLAAFLVPISILFIVANAVLHAITDYISSRITSILWQKGERHWFFVTIGADQAFHMTCLFFTYFWFVMV